jgi:acyl-CoA synthetase (AMP-forming)/AMP-acid ligase II
MIEPWQRDWGDDADWSDVAKVEARVPALLEQFRTHYADRPLMIFDDHSFTYGALEAQSAVLARQLLAAGVAKGCRIGLMLPSDESFLTAWMAVTRIGAVAVTLPTLARPAEIHKISVHADLHMLFSATRYLHHDYVARLSEAFPGVAAGHAPHRLVEAPYLREIWFWGEGVPAWAHKVDLSAAPGVGADLLAAAEAQVHPSDPGGIIYTSGSTAEPKGVVHSQGSFVRQGMKLAASFRYRGDERIYAAMPFFWVGGLVSTVMCIMAVGGAMLSTAKTGAELLDFLEAQGVTAVVAWPHQLRALAADPTFASRDWSKMRSGQLYEALPPASRPADSGLMLPPLGMTETSAVYTVLQRNTPEDQRGSVGPLQRGVTGQLVDAETGEIVATYGEGETTADSGGRSGIMYIRSDVMMMGMVKREHADVFTADGWYVTGDVLEFRNGHIHYRARADDLIKSAGANVSPGEVEAALLKMPQIAAAHVAGVPDEVRGSVVGAVIIPEPGVKLDAETVRKEVSKSLASYKVPRVILFADVADLPRLPSSKVDRKGVSKMLADANASAPAGAA